MQFLDLSHFIVYGWDTCRCLGYRTFPFNNIDVLKKNRKNCQLFPKNLFQLMLCNESVKVKTQNFAHKEDIERKMKVFVLMSSVFLNFLKINFRQTWSLQCNLYQTWVFRATYIRHWVFRATYIRQWVFRATYIRHGSLEQLTSDMGLQSSLHKTMGL